MNDLSLDSLRLDRQLCFKLYAASRAVIRGYKPMLEQLGLTYPQYLVMLVLWEWHEAAPEQPTVKALGERLLLDSGTLTPLLKRLEQVQFVQRQRSPRDEREVHLSLTATGWALREQVAPLKARLLCDSGVDLGRLDELRDGLDQLLAYIKEP
ncbi:MarR family winged helix-turn-helix transcriptional regulator [Pseudomonas gingeri]|uniref:MarR family transcriptional regulator n=2 Tax=Pseudomonas gingeri TaxID=117681 RepID=A0A7Y8CIT2_9PSED|nr:MarR family transcriptional regulator [Pseudomonas gingeri]NWA00038.1 MarR family transcriptional regulator [Pseudomonas gingeri]NWA16877.1 MarR family transcriptional regulator [Pseudomonas gingeri]NWA53737.1 MarR family transcriptional regulator [Pseudomonas gingeri]NWA93969.1 MarR family transcriptional regulator [Pseudomonas gingeri]NWB02131.1 MarR family transcriptional regulator [Pseudomonas gingeri]